MAFVAAGGAGCPLTQLGALREKTVIGSRKVSLPSSKDGGPTHKVPRNLPVSDFATVAAAQ
jgi:hypothetical protein